MSSRPIALVTGASLGIGTDLAREAARDGHDLILVARSKDRLEALAAELKQAHGAEAHVIAMDLATQDAARKLYAEVTARGLAVDVLINNAGYGQYGRFLDLDAAEDAKMLQLNMILLTELTRAFAKDMVTRKRGRILNVASTAAFQPGPLMSTYYATKAYVLSFSEALANELAEAGVTVTALCPGPTTSGFQEKAQMGGSRILSLGLMTSAKVASCGYDGLRRGRAVVIPGMMNHLLVQSLRVTPRAMVRKISRYISDRG